MPCPKRTNAGTTGILVRKRARRRFAARLCAAALAVRLPHTPRAYPLSSLPLADPPLGPHCPPTTECARDFVIRAPDDHEGNGPAACGAACITLMGVESTTGEFTIKVGLESGHECYCGGVDTTVLPAYKSTLDQCNTPCSGGIIGTCDTTTGVGCCGGTWNLNSVEVKCTGVPIAPPGAGTLQPPSWGWVGIMGGGLVFAVFIALGVLINSVILQRRSCSLRKDDRENCIFPMISMWLELPFLVVDGVRTTFSRGKFKPQRTRGDGICCANVQHAADAQGWNPDYVQQEEDSEDEDDMVARAIAERAARDGAVLKNSGARGYGSAP